MATYSDTEIAATLRSWGINSVRQMEQITTELLCRMPTEPVISGGGSNLEGAGDPTSETPDFEGQYYEDTDTGNLWKSNSTTTGDWTLALQNAQIQWEPKSIEILHASGYITLWDNSVALQDITSLTLLNTTFEEALYIVDAEELETFSAPNLTSTIGNAEFTIQGCAVLTSISAPSLQTTANAFSIIGNPSLTSVTLTSFVASTNNAVNITGCPLLVSLSLPALFPIDAHNYNFSSNAFDVTTVDHILERLVSNPAYVSGSVNLNGGTNAAPSGTGALMVIELQGRGVTVNTN